MALGALAACADAPSGESSDAPATEQRSTAVLFVERHAAEGAEHTAHVGARFVQFAGVAPDALPDLLGTPGLPGAVPACTEHRESTMDPSGGAAEVRLLDVGPIDVQAGDRALRLEPRRFPDLFNVISGVIYATDGDLPSTEWRFAAPGGAESHVGAFEVASRSPDELANVTLADQAVVPGGALVLPRRGFVLRWTPGERDDAVVVAFEPDGAESAETIVCSARDEGTLEVDAQWAERIAELARAGAAVTVHRVRSRPFAVASVDNARLVFDLSIRTRASAE